MILNTVRNFTYDSPNSIYQTVSENKVPLFTTISLLVIGTCAYKFNKFLKERQANLNKMLFDNVNPHCSYFRTAQPISKHNIPVIKQVLKNGANTNAKDIDGKSPLHHAAYYAHFKCIKMLLKRGANPNALDQEGKNPLHYAAPRANLECIKILLEKGANPNILDQKGNSPPQFLGRAEQDYSDRHMTACMKAFIQHGANIQNIDIHPFLKRGSEFLEFLMQKGVNPNRINRNGVEPLSQILKLDHPFPETSLKMIEILLKHHADPHSRDLRGNNLLNYFAQGNNLNGVNLMLQYEADPNSLDSEGNPPLHGAVDANNAAIVETLLNNKADVNIRDSNNKTAFHKIGGNDYPFLSQKKPMILSAKKSIHLRIAELLIQKKADVNAKDNYGYTPLHYAVKNPFYELVKLLIDNDSDPKAVDSKNQTPLHLVAAYFQDEIYIHEFLKIAKLLIQKKADVNAIDNEGCTPLHYAAQNASYELANLLIENGANPNAPNMKNETPLHLTMKRMNDNNSNNCFKIAEVLTQKKADVNAIDNEGCTPLHRAVEKGCYEIVKLFINNGADPNAVCYKKNTLLHLLGKHSILNSKEAQDEQYLKIIELLLSRGANVNAENQDKMNILFSFARRLDSPHSIQYLIKSGAQLFPLGFLFNPETQEEINSMHIDLLLKTILLCIEKGVEPNATDKDGNTFFHLIPSEEHIQMQPNFYEILKLLNEFYKKRPKIILRNLNLKDLRNRELGVKIRPPIAPNLNLKNKDGDAPLHVAAKRGCKLSVTTFLELGADPRIQNADGLTYLQILQANDVLPA